MIRFSPHITVAQAAQAANAINCLLIPDMKGGAVIMSRAEWVVERQVRRAMLETQAEERHGNLGWVPVHHSQRVNQRDLPAPEPVEVVR